MHLPSRFIANGIFVIHAKCLCQGSLSGALSLWLLEDFLDRLAQALARIDTFDPDHAILTDHVAWGGGRLKSDGGLLLDETLVLRGIIALIDGQLPILEWLGLKRVVHDVTSVVEK